MSSKQWVDTISLAVEMLEGIFGLNEEALIRFKERAAALARRQESRSAVHVLR
jgi:hypothetical protein